MLALSRMDVSLPVFFFYNKHKDITSLLSNTCSIPLSRDDIFFDECFKEFDLMCSKKSKDLSLASHEGGIIYSLL